MDPLVIGEHRVSLRKKPILIAGPCVLEDEEDAVRIARKCAELAEENGFFYIFKSSYLKDNRSSLDSYVGPGLEDGLRILDRVRGEVGVPVLTDVHCREEISSVADVCDVLQIPAFLARQTRLIVSAAKTGKVLNLKKAQFLSPEEMELAVDKARRSGAASVMVTERGTLFGYNNLVVDMTSFPRMRHFGVPLIMDVTHSLQLPGGSGTRSGGRPEFAGIMARSAAAAGCDGFFIETHFAPSSCKSDAESMLQIDKMPDILREVSQIFDLVNSFD
ncbi:MAG: 3-deoxy-8-phosphooctulonate synthase [Candidatus Krumholzibacteriota bacterium]|nr:3-deoxy-8-phosphooctulonate synthase [Candidatus Krumholzibacteriota bacterium]